MHKEGRPGISRCGRNGELAGAGAAPASDLYLNPIPFRVQVAVYVDGVRVGVAPASGETPHHIIHRLCELDLARNELEQPPQQVGVGFRLRLPDLQQGRHEVRRCTVLTTYLFISI